jgi:hypothetical protein
MNGISVLIKEASESSFTFLLSEETSLHLWIRKQGPHQTVNLPWLVIASLLCEAPQ